MKLSVSLPEADVAALDRYVREVGLASRSSGLRHAIAQLRSRTLEQDYVEAWSEWDSSGQEIDWSASSNDGLIDA